MVRGTSSAVLLSILIHAGLFLLAGILVVFTVVKKQEQKFDPPKAVERPKMKLKKPKVDYWVIGSEIGGNRYILLDKGNASFVPSEQPQGLFEITGNTVDLFSWVLGHIYLQSRGERYKGFLITITDERGVMIANRSSPTWLFKNLDNLRQLEPGSFLDDECNRVWPTPLKSARK